MCLQIQLLAAIDLVGLAAVYCLAVIALEWKGRVGSGYD